MNYKRLLLTCLMPLGLLAGCGKQGPKEDSFVTDLAKGFQFLSKISGSKEDKKFHHTLKQDNEVVLTAAIDGSLTYKTFKTNENFENLGDGLFETWTRKKIDGKNLATNIRLDISNTINYYPVMNVATSEYFLFDKDGFDNPFKHLSIKAFDEVEDNVYKLKTGIKKYNKAYKEFSANLYGQPGWDIQELIIYLNEEEVPSNLTATMTFDSPDFIYTYNFETLIDEVAPEKIETRAEILPDVKDETFEKGFKLLQGQNFNLEQAEFYYNDENDIVNTELRLVSSTPTSYLSERHYLNDEGKKVTDYEGGLKNGKKYVNVSWFKSTEGDIVLRNAGTLDELFFNAHYVPFDAARACFDYNPDDDVYQNLKGPEFDIYDFSGYESPNELAKFVLIKFNKNQSGDIETIQMQLVGSRMLTQLTFKDFGKITPITISDL